MSLQGNVRKVISQPAKQNVSKGKKEKDHLSSNQQLLIKQTMALKGTIDFRQLENRVIHLNRQLKASKASKNEYFEAFKKLLSHAEHDMTSLRMQSVTTQALLNFFGRRHSVNIQQSAQGLTHTIEHFNQSMEQLEAAFNKKFGPGFFSKQGSLSLTDYDALIVQLANLYKETLLTLHEWHKNTSAALVRGSKNRQTR